MKLFTLIFSVIALLSWLPNSYAANGQQFISDTLFVPVRSGAGSQYRIVHRGLKSGTALTVIEQNEAQKWSKIRTNSGVEGWVPSQYLTSEPTADIQLKKAEKTIARLSSKAGPLSDKLLQAEKETQVLQEQLTQTKQEKNVAEKELARIQKLSDNVITLDQENKSLIQENEQLKHQRDTLTAENNRLSQQLKSDEFIYGAYAILLGMLATLIIQYLTRSRRRASEWR